MGKPQGTVDRANGYEREAAEFMARRTDSRIGVAEVRRWARGLPPGAVVLDLGCGHGVPMSQALMDEGCAVWGVDASPTLVTAFRARFPGVEVECGRVEDSLLFSRTFDGVLAWGLMFLLEPETQSLVLERAAAALDAGGQMLFTAPAQLCEWVDVLTGRRSASLGAEAYIRILAGAGMDLLEQYEDEGENHYFLAAKR